MDDSNDWGLEAVVRSCDGGTAAAEAAEPPPRQESEVDVGQPGRAAASSSSLYDVLEYLDLEHRQLPRAPFSITSSSRESEVRISFPGAASTSGQVRPARKHGGGKPGGRAPRRPKRRGYYKCNSLKECMARKLVERSPAKPGVLVITYIADHCHAVPTHINTLAGTARDRPHSPPISDDTADMRQDDGADVSSSTATVSDTGAGGDSELWLPVDIDDMFGAFDEDLDHFFDDDDNGIYEQSVSL